MTLLPRLLATTLVAALSLPVAQAAESPLFKTPLHTLDGKRATLAQWRGKPLVVNFWATWCSPCREEIPEFVALQKKYADRVQFVGIAIDDAAAVRAFIKQYKVNYPSLIGEGNAMKAMQVEGNTVGGLPFTALYDAQGNKVAVELGRLKGAKLESLLQPLLQKPKKP
ncbi:TlpA family protein disulfide reductase [Chitiniphilus eburneus]|uniref:TlpA family protein disulfide reductase n=1 Tax=Chitiniphilus eburneus TaxID=2571148 RepID=A0A4U0Q385_9NEIS|nr:TlpA disulfide reductase family protein [Chitiniphilus eburneus]TJZ75517.1 TlpA family protein disulfide reductase [Chitiniphilus eburneus]